MPAGVGGRQASATRRETVDGLRHPDVREQLGQRGVGAERVAPEEAERLIEELEVLRPPDEDRVERPVELVAAEHVDGGRGGEGVESARRPQAEAGAAQEAGEMDDVLRQLRAHRRPWYLKGANEKGGAPRDAA